MEDVRLLDRLKIADHRPLGMPQRFREIFLFGNVLCAPVRIPVNLRRIGAQYHCTWACVIAQESHGVQENRVAHGKRTSKDGRVARKFRTKKPASKAVSSVPRASGRS